MLHWFQRTLRFFLFSLWVVEGAGRRDALLAIKDFGRLNHVDILVILEPRISGRRAKRLIAEIAFSKTGVSDATAGYLESVG